MRAARGSQSVEFAAALIVVFVFIFIPLLDLTIVPVRWMMAQELVNGYARRLALCETFNQSRELMQADPSLATKLLKLGGVDVSDIALRMRITRINTGLGTPEFKLVEMPGTIPAEWLPDGAKAPCSYSLEVEVQSRVSPAILLSNSNWIVPGLTAPFPMIIRAAHEWENLGRDPKTGKFFLNE